MLQKIILTFGFTFIVLLVFSQPGGSPTPSGGGAVGAPIDGGLSILLAAGAAYGAKKIYDYKKNNDEEL